MAIEQKPAKSQFSGFSPCLSHSSFFLLIFSVPDLWIWLSARGQPCSVTGMLFFTGRLYSNECLFCCLAAKVWLRQQGHLSPFSCVFCGTTWNGLFMSWLTRRAFVWVRKHLSVSTENVNGNHSVMGLSAFLHLEKPTLPPAAAPLGAYAPHYPLLSLWKCWGLVKLMVWSTMSCWQAP